MELDLTTTIARCWTVTRADKMKFLFTDHDSDLTINGEKFSSASPLQMSAIEKNIGLDPDNVEISGVFEHELILKEDLENGLFDQAEIFCFEYDWKKQQVVNELFSGNFASHSYAEGDFNVETHSAFSKLSRVFGRGYHRTCDAELGDKKCGIDLNEIGKVFTKEVSDFNEFSLQVSKIDNVEEGDFTGGTVILFSGDTVVSKLSIRRDQIIGNLHQFEFWRRLTPLQLSADRVQLSVGCDKSISCCNKRFSNAINFRGFPYIPNDDWIQVKQDTANDDWKTAKPVNS